MKKLGILTAVVALALTAIPAQAQTHSKIGYAAGLLGLAIPTQSGTSVRFDYGARAGYQLTDLVSAGVYVLTNSESVNVTVAGNTTSGSNRFWLYGVEGNYALSDLMNGLYGGVRLGLATAKATANGVSATATDFALGPKVGYDYPLSDSFSTGAEADAQFVFGNSTDAIFNVVGQLKYAF